MFRLLALSDSDVIALSILAVGVAAFAVLGGGLFYTLWRSGRQAQAEAQIFEGLEDVFREDEENHQAAHSTGDDKPVLQDWEKDADWWKA